jgi:dihydrofolate reductase
VILYQPALANIVYSLLLLVDQGESSMKTLITEFISLDGVVQAPGGAKEDTDGGFTHGGWSMKYFDPEVMGNAYAELAKQSDALLQGRRTYQVSASAWPGRSGDVFSDWINRVQKYVVSDTLTEKDLTWNPTTIIRGDDFVKRVSGLRAQPGGYIYIYGSAMMVRSLLAADLVDELLLTIEPIILGGGKTIFAENGKALPFTLVSTAQASTGAQVCRYVRAW